MNRDLENLERWAEEHPVAAHWWTVGISLAVLFLAALLRLAVER